MVASGRRGVVVNISSIAGRRPTIPGVSHYATSKAGIEGLTRALALELSSHGIRVLAIAPSIIVTPGMDEASRAFGADVEAMASGSPLGRTGVADDVARVALFCASDLSSLMTGATLVVDGGDLLR